MQTPVLKQSEQGVIMTDPLRKAAEMALEALETLWDILDDIDTASDMAKENDAWYRKRVEALQKKRWDTMITTDGYKLKDGPVEALRQALAQPEQEPVAWVECAVIPWLQSKDTNVYAMTKLHRIPNEHYDTPLYTAPPKREWVGLTDEEVESWRGNYDFFDSALVREIEAKLKEKNT